MQCKVLEVRKVNTRFGERQVLTVEHPEGGEEEVWANPDFPVEVGDMIPVDEDSSTGKLKLSKSKNGKSSGKTPSRSSGDAVAELVGLFKSIRDALPDESSEAVAKLAITLFLRK